jgi:hypothetical protein
LRPQMGHVPESPARLIDESDPRLVEALLRAARSNGHDTPELHSLVCEIVAGARQAHMTPEAVIIFLKRQMERTIRYEMDRVDYNSLVERVVRWCVDQYFGDS